MTQGGYLRTFRRRWAIVLVTMVVALAAGWLTTRDGGTAPPSSTFISTVTLLDTGSSSRIILGLDGEITNLDTIAALTTVGEVPSRAALALGATDPVALAAQVTTNVDGETGFMEITAIAATAAEAEDVARTFTDELLGYLTDRKQALIDAEVTTLTEQIQTLQDEIRDLDGQLENAEGAEVNTLTAERTTKQQSLQTLRDERQALQAPPAEAPLEVIQDAVTEASTEGGIGIEAPTGRLPRLLIAGVIGLILGLLLALLVDRFDTRIRTKDAAEEYFGMPVLAEIPRVRRRQRRRLAMTRPWAQPANAYRLLAAGVTARGTPEDGLPHLNGGGDGEAERHPQTILVTSAIPSEGKSTIAANLAAAYAESGKSVLVLSCDFRRPSIHHLLGVPNDRGLAEALYSSNGGPILYGAVKASQVPGVVVVPSGDGLGAPSELLSSEKFPEAIEEARTAADVIVLDSAPILAAGESAHLIPQADAVLVVARAGKITPELADRMRELLERLGAPTVGIALNRAQEAPTPHYYRDARTSRHGKHRAG